MDWITKGLVGVLTAALVTVNVLLLLSSSDNARLTADNDKLGTDLLRAKRANVAYRFECKQRESKGLLLNRLGEDYEHTEVMRADGNYTVKF